MVRFDAITINHNIETTIFAAARITIAFSIAEADQAEKKRTAGHEIA
ncbi:unannotated protein [freshwater metagenome]|uniref:Unannotated protein n=1 Tax=freshwater metagenome TaxID=449393 RepID=A0A6J7EW70_9ZZZZ